MTRTYKQTIALIVLLFTANMTFAQAPQGIPYQAVARNSSGVILVSQPIRVRFTIHDLTTGGTTLYQETFSPTTTAQGLFSVNVGTGTVVSGTFSSITWGTNAKYLQVEMDPTGGTSYINMGTTQMMSVPYSLYSNNGIPAGNYTGDMLYWNGSAWVHVAAGTNGQIITNVNGVPTWTAPILTIGARYGGGIVAYILQPGDPGYDANLEHGLIAATSDVSSSAQWGCQGTTIGGTGTAIGTGAANTPIIISGCGTTGIAAQLCRNYNGGGYTDWYLPSRDELNELYLNQAVIGGFSLNIYWSSSESNANSSWSQLFANGNQDAFLGKSNDVYVRAVRAF